MTLHISEGRSATDRHMIPRTLTWEEFASRMSQSEPVPVGGTKAEHIADPDKSKAEKLACAGFVPGDLIGPRSSSNVDTLSLYVADLDGISYDVLKARLEEWRERGLAFVLSSTWKHGFNDTSLRMRVVFPLAERAEGKTWGDTWEALTSWLRLKGLADPACKDAARIYFYPSHPVTDEGPIAEPFYLLEEGDPLPLVTLKQAREREAKDEFVRYLGHHWPGVGNRHSARLALAGALYKSGLPEEEAERLVTDVNRAGGSTEDDDATKAVADTYSRDAEDVAGWGALAAIIGDDVADLARKKLGADALNAEALADMAATLKRKQKPSDKALGDALTRALAGGAVTSEEVTKLARHLANTYPAASPDAISDVLTKANCTDKAPDVTGLVARVRESEREAADARATRQEQERALRIRDAFGYDRTTGYTDDEIAHFQKRLGRNPWIVQRGASVFVLVGGQYRHYTQHDAIAAMATDLAPAHTAGISLYATNQNGDPVPKGLSDLVRDYGRVAQAIAYSLALQEPEFDERTRTLRLPTCPLRDLEPTYSERVSSWLASFEDERLIDWVSVATRLDRPCAALYLQGDGGVGKSLLARGLSRLWTTDGETDASAIVGAWNDGLLKCPLTFADERLPDEWKIRQGTGKIRQFIQATSRPFSQKFHTHATIEGAVRLIIAANGDLFSYTNEDLTPGDIAAIGERFLQIPATRKPRKYLATIFGDGEEADRDRVHAAFVDGDEIAKHALWLRDNHVFAPQGRFFFRSEFSGVASTLNVMSGLRSNLCEWFCAYLKDPSRLQQMGDARVMVRDGEIWANSSAVVQHWEAYTKQDVKRPQTNRVADSLTALSHATRRKHNGVNYRVIRTDNLIAWARRTDYLTAEEIRALLEKHSSKVDAS